MDEVHGQRIWWLAGGVLVCGLGAGGWLVATKPAPPHHDRPRPAPSVQVVRVEPTRFDAPIEGFGTLRAKRQVKIIPEVSGKILETHPDLALGNVIRQGEVLFRIDPRSYETQVIQIEAEVARLQAQLKQFGAQRDSLAQRLTITEQQAALAAAAVEREQALSEQNASTDPELEAARAQQLKIAELLLQQRGELELLPLREAEVQALLTSKQAQLDEARLSIAKTTLRCPFDARVDAVFAQASQVVTAHFQIASLTDLEALELPVVIDPRELRWAARSALASATGEDVADAPQAEVSWTLLGREFTWQGPITRLEKLDEATRTAHVVVELRDIMDRLAQARVNGQVPISVGMFCRARLPSEPLEEALVIPRGAIQEGGTVYVFEPDPAEPGTGRLALKRVPLLRSVGDRVLVAYGSTQGDGATTRPAEDEHESVCELRRGDEVIVSLLPKAVPGMRLRREAGPADATTALHDRPAAEFPMASSALLRSGRHEHAWRPLSGPVMAALFVGLVLPG